jgi:hypothetical protein
LFSNKNIYPFIEQFIKLKRNQVLKNQELSEDNCADRNYYREKVMIMSIYKVIRLFIWIICVAFIVG